jgi:hypothetical protein
MLIEVKQLGDAVISYGGGEEPKYQALADAISGFYKDLLRPLKALEGEAFMLLGLPSPQKQEEPRFRYTALKRSVVDRAIDLFLEEVAGPQRDRKGYVEGGPQSDTPDGVLQQWQRFSFAVGLRRGADLVDRAQTLSAERTSPATRAMLDNAFTRLSEGGKLKIEKWRDQIHSVLVSATEAGLGPLDTGRQLSGLFTNYKRVQFDRLARTEAAFAAEEGSRNQMIDMGVTHVKWLLSGNACPVCLSFEGLIIPIEDASRQPPGASHPNCACSVSPVTAEDLFR